MSDVVLGEFSTDVTPPEVTNPSPTGVGAARDTDVEFDITDTEAGVDLGSLGMIIGGVDVIVGGVFETPDYDGTIVDTGGGTWHVAVTTHPDFASYITVSITIDGQDQAPLANVMGQYSWSFETEDYEAPYVDVGSNSPTGTGVPVTTLIEFDLKDDGAGVDLASVIVTVGGVLAYDGSAGGFQLGFDGLSSTVTGTMASYHFVIDADPNYVEWVTYEVIVNADDLAL